MDLGFVTANGPEDNQIILYEAGIQIIKEGVLWNVFSNSLLKDAIRCFASYAKI